MAFVRVGQTVFHAECRGDPTKPLVAFANSLGTDARIWRDVVEGLLGRYRVLLYDKRGHGLSEDPPGPASIADHAADFLGLLDHFAADRCALVGLSVGGQIAQQIAATRGDRLTALVLCDTASRIGTTESWNARIEAVATGGVESIADAVMDRWFTGDYRSRQPDALRGWRTMLARQPAHGYAATCAAIRDADLGAEVARIAVPTLCVVGESDLSTPPALVRATAARIPGARFATIPNAGHLPCIEQPAALTRLIADHLEGAGHV